MPKKILYLLAFLSIIWLAPLQAEELQKLTFDIERDRRTGRASAANLRSE